MPGKKKKYNSRFPPARIKKIMQSDEEVGKVAAPVPVIISRALELFVQSLLLKAGDVTIGRGARTLTPSHLKECINNDSRYDFLNEHFKSIADIGADGDAEMAVCTTPLSATGAITTQPFFAKSDTVNRNLNSQRGVRVSGSKTSSKSSPPVGSGGLPVKRPRGRPRKIPIEKPQVRPETPHSSESSDEDAWCVDEDIVESDEDILVISQNQKVQSSPCLELSNNKLSNTTNSTEDAKITSPAFSVQFPGGIHISMPSVNKYTTNITLPPSLSVSSNVNTLNGTSCTSPGAQLPTQPTGVPVSVITSVQDANRVKKFSGKVEPLHLAQPKSVLDLDEDYDC